MSKVFFPTKSSQVKASPPHPDNTIYKVSIWIEHWEGVACEGIKIQMVYDGKISGRRSPTFPIDKNGESPDFEKVKEAISQLLSR